jgi:hypothetical protein
VPFNPPSLRGCLAALIVLLPAAGYAGQAVPSPSPAAAQTAAVQAPAPPRPPLLNRANERLPTWLRVRGEFRERVEGFDGAGFDGRGEDLYYLSRFRVNATIAPNRALAFQVQAQDARVARKTIGPTAAPFSAPIDLRMAFADVGAATGPLSARVGRQELVYGEHRLVGHVSWLNAARTFDGAKVTFRTRAMQVDAFGASVVRIMDGAFDRSGNGNRFAGTYVTLPKVIPQATVEPFAYWKRDVRLRAESGVAGNLSIATIGTRLAGRLPARLDYGIEMALQRGSLASDSIESWAGHWQLRESLPGPSAMKITGEYNYASGDASSSDGVRGTFDQLYPTPHDKYGLADQVGWKNIHHARAGFEITPVKGWPIAANYHSWWLAEPTDGLYTAGSALLARVAGGASDRHVGQEIDVQLVKPLTPQIQVAAGYAHIFAGPFLRQATPGASYRHPYVMVTYVFLAER